VKRSKRPYDKACSLKVPGREKLSILNTHQMGHFLGLQETELPPIKAGEKTRDSYIDWDRLAHSYNAMILIMHNLNGVLK